jgi:exosortase/archaeosortase family protein
VKGKKNLKQTKLIQKKVSPKVLKKLGFSENGKLLIFAIKFFLIFFILSSIIEILPLAWLNELIAGIASLLVGLPAQNAIIYANGAIFIVGNACTGLMSASILAATIFSLNKPNLTKKLTLFLIGLGILLIVNIPRVALVLLFSKAGFDANLVHELTWFIMSGVILFIWYFGMKKMYLVKDFSELI